MALSAYKESAIRASRREVRSEKLLALKYGPYRLAAARASAPGLDACLSSLPTLTSSPRHEHVPGFFPPRSSPATSSNSRRHKLRSTRLDVYRDVIKLMSVLVNASLPQVCYDVNGQMGRNEE